MVEIDLDMSKKLHMPLYIIFWTFFLVSFCS